MCKIGQAHIESQNADREGENKMIWIKPAFPYRWTRFTGFLKNIKWFGYWCQNFFIRGAQGWVYDNTASIDCWLVSMLPAMLKDLRGNNHGYPEGMTEDIWREKLNIMIIGFEAAGRLLDLDYFDDTTGKINQGEYDELTRLFDNGMKEFHEHFFNLWD